MSKKVYLSTNTLQSNHEIIRIFTKFNKPIEIDKIKSEDIIAEMTILTSACSYEGVVKRKNINKELAWNSQLFNRLENAISGKSNNLIINIQNTTYGNKILIIAIELQMKLIRIILFEVQLKLLSSSPFATMRLLMNALHQQKQQTILEMKSKEKREKQRINEIDQLFLQLKHNNKDQIGLYKEKFIPVINQAKKKLIKCFGNSTEAIQELSGLMQDQEVTKRQIFKINKNRYKGQNKKQKDDMRDQVQELFGPLN